jgi:hypothetical protein
VKNSRAKHRPGHSGDASHYVIKFVIKLSLNLREPSHLFLPSVILCCRPAGEGHTEHKIIMYIFTPCLVGIVSGFEVYLHPEVQEFVYQDSGLWQFLSYLKSFPPGLPLEVCLPGLVSALSIAYLPHGLCHRLLWSHPGGTSRPSRKGQKQVVHSRYGQ